jgi:surface carbohydrate biosynthesis protein
MYDILIIGQEDRDKLQFFPLKYILENKYGLKVYIDFNFMNYKYLINKIKPKIILSYQVSAPFLVDMYTIGRQLGCINISFRSEGIFYDDVDPNIMGVREPYGSLVDFEILWGTLFKKKLEKTTSLQYEKRLVLGAPKYSFFTKNKKSIFLSRRELNEILTLDGREANLNIVFATGYGISERNLTDISTMPEYGFDNGENLHLLEEFQKMKKQRILERNEMLKAIVNLVQNTSYNIILKIHPNELIYTENNLKIYNEIKKFQSKNFRIVYPNDNISANDLFDYADIWFHRGSTTTIEAWMNNIITVEMNFEHDKSIMNTGLTKGSLVVTNAEEINKLLSQKLSISDEMREVQEKLIYDYFNGIDNNADFKISEFLYRNVQSYRKLEIINIFTKINLYGSAKLFFIKLEILALLGRRKSNKCYQNEFNEKYKSFLSSISKISNYI